MTKQRGLIKQLLSARRADANRLLLLFLTPLVIRGGKVAAQMYAQAWGMSQLAWYDHLYDHLQGPENWYWLERGILASDCIRQGDRVLDLCCGEGSYTGIFLSQRASLVDAVDSSTDAIHIAMKRWARPNICFRMADALYDPFPRREYDVVVLNAALEYFSIDEGHKLLDKISAVLAPGRGILFGSTPVWGDRSSANFGQRSFTSNVDELEQFLHTHFNEVALRLSRETRRTVYYFTCK